MPPASSNAGVPVPAAPSVPTLFLTADGGLASDPPDQLRISVDLTGDGAWDRVETYRYFATDPIPDAELYTESAGILTADGAWGDLNNGVVRVEVWAALGDNPSTLDLGEESFVTLPMS